MYPPGDVLKPVMGALLLYFLLLWPLLPAGAAEPRIRFDLSELDANGLRGPPDGKVAVDYEFCIPDTPDNRQTVLAIDSSVRFLAGSRGRSDCGPGQILCIGNTGQPDGKAVLERLAGIPWVSDIRECFWE